MCWRLLLYQMTFLTLIDASWKEIEELTSNSVVERFGTHLAVMLSGVERHRNHSHK